MAAGRASGSKRKSPAQGRASFEESEVVGFEVSCTASHANATDCRSAPYFNTTTFVPSFARL